MTYHTILLLAIFFNLSSCTQNESEKSLIGKWLIEEYKIKFLPSKVDNERLDYEIDKLKRNSYFIFFPNFDYEIRMNEMKEKGKWKINTGKKKLSLIQDKSHEEKLLNIDSLGSKVIIITGKWDSLQTQIKLKKSKNL
jgi:hypothetical protein